MTDSHRGCHCPHTLNTLSSKDFKKNFDQPYLPTKLKSLIHILCAVCFFLSACFSFAWFYFHNNNHSHQNLRDCSPVIVFNYCFMF